MGYLKLGPQWTFETFRHKAPSPISVRLRVVVSVTVSVSFRFTVRVRLRLLPRCEQISS